MRLVVEQSALLRWGEFVYGAFSCGRKQAGAEGEGSGLTRVIIVRHTSARTSMPSRRQYSGTSAAYIINESMSQSETLTNPTSMSASSDGSGATLRVAGCDVTAAADCGTAVAGPEGDVDPNGILSVRFPGYPADSAVEEDVTRVDPDWDDLRSFAVLDESEVMDDALYKPPSSASIRC